MYANRPHFRVLYVLGVEVTSDLRTEVEIWPFCACAMHPAIIIGRNSSFIVDFSMGQIPRSTYF